MGFILRVLNRAIPEGNLRNRLISFIFNRKGFVPKELMANKGDFVVQVGTPHTITISKLSKSVGKKGKVILIEPEENNVRKIEEYVKTNALNNVIIVPKAAWSKKGQLKLTVSTNASDHKINHDEIIHDNDFREDEKYISSQIVEVDTVDNIMQSVGLNRIDFIEIAVNGAELEVLQGMEEMIKNVNRLFVKGHARFKKDNRPINKTIASFLRERGFNTIITKPTKSVAEDKWGKREGDVYAWKK
jgi:FkbM family methyltransferase